MRLLPVLALLLALTPAIAPAAHAAGTHVVDVVNNAFRDSANGTPVTRVGVGTTVTWLWLAGVHTVTEGLHGAVPVAPAFDSGSIDVADPNPTYSVTFTTPGTYAYFCERHVAVMRGVLVVE